jgi:hypothetical protein
MSTDAYLLFLYGWNQTFQITTMVGTNFAGVVFVESSKNIHHFIKKIGLP